MFYNRVRLLSSLGYLTGSPVLREIIGQPKNQLDVREEMESGKILLCRLSKGAIGEQEASLLGSFLITDVQISTLQRQHQPEGQRRDFFLYVDEFENYATESFSTIFSEARKYRLILTVAFQFIDQLDPTTRRSLFGNVQTQLSFQLGPEDSEILARQLGGRVTPEDLMNLPRYHAYVRMMLRDRVRPPFLMKTVMFPDVDSDRNSAVEDAVRAGQLRSPRRELLPGATL